MEKTWHIYTLFTVSHTSSVSHPMTLALSRSTLHFLTTQNNHTNRTRNMYPTKSKHSTADACNPTEDIEWLWHEEEVHNYMVRVHASAK